MKLFSVIRTLIRAACYCSVVLFSWRAAAAAQFTYRTENGGAAITGGPNSGSVVIPSVIDGFPVTGIAYGAFDDVEITDIIIPEGVTAIGSWAFANSLTLTNAVIPSTVTNIAEGAFTFCYKLLAISVDPRNPIYESVDGVLFEKNPRTLVRFPLGRPGRYSIPAGTLTVGKESFAGRYGDYSSVTIPASVTRIEFYAFGQSPSLTGLFFEGDAPSIDPSAFENNAATIYYTAGTTGWSSSFGGRPASLWDPASGVIYKSDHTNATVTGAVLSSEGATITVPSSIAGLPVTKIADETFANRWDLTRVVLSEGIASIGTEAFARSTLSAITLPNSLAEIGTNAFADCSSLTALAIPSGVINIGDDAFRNCTALNAVSVDPLNPAFSSIDGILFDKSGSVLLKYPLGNSRTSYRVPDGVTRIAANSFANCALASVTLPSSVTAIERSAFEDSFQLTEVYFLGNAPSIDLYAFLLYEFGPWGRGVFTVTTFYYPPGARGWNSPFVRGEIIGRGDFEIAIPAVPWTSRILTADQNFGVREGTVRFGVVLAGRTNSAAIIETCTNLANPHWTPAATNAVTSGTFSFSEARSTDSPARFYRIRSR